MTSGKYKIPFGRHKGEFIEDVPANYLLWLCDEGVVTTEIKEYVDENRKVLEEEKERNL